MFCRRLARGGRLSLDSANTGNTDCKEKSKESFSHGGEPKQTAGLQSTHFQRTTRSLRKKTAVTTTSHPTTSAITVLRASQNLKADDARSRVERGGGLRYNRARMLDTILGCLKWAAVGFIVAFALMKLFEASHIHDDIPKPAFKIRQTNRATFVLSTFAAMLSALVWLLVQKLD
jgi:hypothetical protein